jgi:putative hydrolase of the HAD superfamily
VAIRAVIFDFGGVLVRLHDPAGRRVWEARLGLDGPDLAQIVFDSSVAERATIGHLPESAVWAHVAATLGLGQAELSEFRHDFWAGDRLDAELAAFARGLRPRHRTAILSNAWDGARRIFTQVYGLDRVVDLMVISAEVGVAKPDPRIYHLALERLGVQPHEAVFVDDMEENVAGARQVGMWAVRFESTDQVIGEVRGLLDDAL